MDLNKLANKGLVYKSHSKFDKRQFVFSNNKNKLLKTGTSFPKFTS
jgi:hypothetical protein